MRICESALAIAFRHPIYLGVYVLFLSALGTFLTIGVQSGSTRASDSAPAAQQEDGYAPMQASVAVIDRDGSELSAEISAHLGETQELVDIADDSFAMQDALATGLVEAIVIVPEGYEADLLVSARSGEELPALQIAYGTDTQAAALLDTQVARWTALASASAALEPFASASNVAGLVRHASAAHADVSVERDVAAAETARPLQAYLSFTSYSITCSVVVCAGLVLSTMNEDRLRARILAAPVPPRRLGLNTLAACVVLVVAVWGVTSVVGLVASGAFASTAGMLPASIVLALMAMLVFAFVPLALAFTFAQARFGEDALNALGNIGGMLMSFLGGAWVPLSLLGDSVRAVAHFVPTFWTNDAVAAVLGAPVLTMEVLARYACGVGVTALFAVAIACVGLALTRHRV